MLSWDNINVNRESRVREWVKGVIRYEGLSKYITFFSEWVSKDSDDPRPRMLYDHSVDPDENFNISESHDYAEIVTGLTFQLRELTEGGND
ncbi:MAG: hypothetical protein ISS19_16000 [Bacteroidales bacterium]|nr:hypothetical protein [Bacteroidales bacterium]